MNSMRDIVYDIRNRFENGQNLDTENIISFKASHPKLFDMITSQHCDLNILNKFLDLYQNVQDGKIDKEQSDVAFGQVLATKFLPKE